MNSVIHADADGSYYLIWNIFVVDTRAVLLRCTTEPPVCIATVEFAGDDTSPSTESRMPQHVLVKT